MLGMLELYYGKQEVLICSRNGQAIRLSYDHKGTDHSESNRVKEKGGFMLNSRVNGII
jgi:protein phosphatase PTC1